MPLIKWQSISQCSTNRERSYLYLPQGIHCLPAPCLPLIVAEWNYSITLLNLIPRTWQGQTRSLLIALKALITVNCFHKIFRQPGKLLPLHLPSHSTLPACHLAHATRLTASLSHLASVCCWLWYFHFASARDQIFKDTRREQHFEFDSETGNPCTQYTKRQPERGERAGRNRVVR